MKKFETKDQNAKRVQIEGVVLNLTHFGAISFLGKTVLFHALLKKKKEISKRCRFERHHKPSSSLGRAKDRGRRGYYVPLQRHYFPLSLPLLAKKKHDSSHTLPPLIQPMPCR
jgi:hypothetical protein